jgi:hypothetical protein
MTSLDVIVPLSFGASHGGWQVVRDLSRVTIARLAKHIELSGRIVSARGERLLRLARRRLRAAWTTERRGVMTKDELPEVLKGNDPEGLRGVADREAVGWTKFSELQLVGLAGWHGVDRVRDAVAVEMQRRLMAAIARFNDAAATQTSRLISLAEETSRQTNKLIVLTKWIIGLTVILGIIASLQL